MKQISRLTFVLAFGLLALGGTSLAEAQARDFGVSRGRATFRSVASLETINGVSNSLTGSISLNPANLAATRGTLTVPISSIRTGIDLRDEHLRGSDWLDAAAHPNATFEITGVEGATSMTANQEAQFTLIGRFTLHGQTKNVRARVRARWDGSGGIRGRATFSIQLSDYNVTINRLVQEKVSNTIAITIDVRAAA